MKAKLRIFGLVLLSVLMVVSCLKKKDEGGDGETMLLSDGWKLVSWNGHTEIAGSVYLQLEDDGTFTLYQQVGNLATAGYRKFTGTYRIEGDDATGQVMSGSYSDGTSWAASYLLESRTSEELRLRSLPENIVSVYERIVIPEYVKLSPVTVSSRGVGNPEPFL